MPSTPDTVNPISRVNTAEGSDTAASLFPANEPVRVSQIIGDYARPAQSQPQPVRPTLDWYDLGVLALLLATTAAFLASLLTGK